MFKHLIVDPERHKIDNLPEEWQILFLANIHDVSAFLYVAIVAPIDHPDEDCAETKVILFTPENFSILDVRRGEKYPWGGGRVEIDNSRGAIEWITSDECGRNEYLGRRIPLENILIAR